MEPLLRDSGSSTEEVDRLVARARGGDRDALGALLGRVRSQLSDVAARRLGSRLRARVRVSDVLQSACCEAISGIDHFRGESLPAFNAWVSQILRNRLKKKGRYFGASKREEPADDGEAAVTPVTETSVSDAAARTEDLAVVERALAALPERQRRVIELRAVAGLDYDEVARRLDVTPANARSLLCRARAALSVEVKRLREERSKTTEAVRTRRSGRLDTLPPSA